MDCDGYVYGKKWECSSDRLQYRRKHSATGVERQVSSDRGGISVGSLSVGDGPNMVLESTVSNTELSEFNILPPPRELSEFLSAYALCVKANLPSFLSELTEFAPKLSEAQ